MTKLKLACAAAILGSSFVATAASALPLVPLPADTLSGVGKSGGFAARTGAGGDRTIIMEAMALTAFIGGPIGAVVGVTAIGAAGE